MNLRRMRLVNFRQFYGEQGPIEFSGHADQNATLIFGANGAGKTTLLNAFTWVLYKTTTPAFAKPERLVSDRALQEAGVGEAVEASVTLEFEHDGIEYIATRRQVEELKDDGTTSIVLDAPLEVTYQTAAGDSEHSKNPQDQMDQILPVQLHNFFFFDGERIERMQQGHASKEIGNAIKSLLGLEIPERAVAHVTGAVRDKVRSELQAKAAPELQQVLDEIGKKEHLIKKHQDHEKEAKENLGATKDLLNDVKEKLRSREETQGIQAALDDLEERHLRCLEDLKTNVHQTKSALTRYGYSSFMVPILEKSAKLIDDKREKGEIPAGIKLPFVEDLIESGKCICGAELKAGTHAHDNVSAWKARAGSTDIEEAAVKVGVQLHSYKEQRVKLFEDLKTLDKTRLEKERLRDDLQAKISEQERLLDKQDQEEIAKLTEKKHRLEEQVIEYSADIKTHSRAISEAKRELDDLKKKEDAIKGLNAEEKLWQRRLKVLDSVGDFFQNLLAQRTDTIRRELDSRVKNVYQSISYKAQWPHITEDIRLVLTKTPDSPDRPGAIEVAKGQGENQILSLAFIASIADFARSRHHDTRGDQDGLELGFEGGLYPLVMDSPFGALDDNYRDAVSKGIPKLAEEVVVLVSKSQGQGIVAANLSRRLDRTYVIAYRTNKKDQKAESITIAGREFPYIEPSDDGTEWAEILEVTS